jgi:hypothetical protein
MVLFPLKQLSQHSLWWDPSTTACNRLCTRVQHVLCQALLRSEPSLVGSGSVAGEMTRNPLIHSSTSEEQAAWLENYWSIHGFMSPLPQRGGVSGCTSIRD